MSLLDSQERGELRLEVSVDDDEVFVPEWLVPEDVSIAVEFHLFFLL